MDKVLKKLQEILKGAAGILYHTLLVALSAGVLLSLPLIATWIDQQFFAVWPLVEKEKIYLVSGETIVAILLIAAMNYVYRSVKDRRLAKIAEDAGLECFVSSQGGFRQRRVRRLKKKHGLARNIMIIGVTGARTLVNPSGDLYPLVQNCLEAKIMLLNPDSEAAWARSRTRLIPGVTIERLQEEVRQSIHFLKRLKAAQKPITLKLYSDPPLVKLAILGDYIWLQHYHPELDVQTMPQYVFKHNQNDHGLYTLFYQYFMKRWESPGIPEYELETDMLVIRGRRNEHAVAKSSAFGAPGETGVVHGDTGPGSSS